MKIISYYTKGTPYEFVANKYLISSIKQFELDSEIVGISNRGGWKNNTDFKPLFIREMLNKYDEVCWLDCDAEIKKYPELLYNIPSDFNIALHKLDWKLQYPHNGTEKLEVLSGTLYLRKEAIFLIDKWIAELKNFNWEQQALDRVLRLLEYKTFLLPASYCAVIDRNYKVPSYIKDPIIVHWQASREFKRIVGR